MERETRQRNATATKARILTAAQDAFAEHGYASVGIREIAGRAGVASSLLMRYFGSKAALYEEALIDGLHHGQFTSEKDTFGETMAHLMNTATDKNLTMMLVLAAGDPEARVIAQRVAQDHMIKTLETWLGPPHERARALAMLSVMTGFVIYRHLFDPVPPSAELSAWLSQTLQRLAVPEGSALSG